MAATSYAELPCGLAAPEVLAGHPDRLLANGPGVPVVACGEPGIGLAHFGCPHEHFNTVNVCGTCAAELQRVAGLIVCQFCEDSSASHECKPRVWIAWYDGSAVTEVQERAA